MNKEQNINTIDPDKLRRVVTILAEHRNEVDKYIEASIFMPFGIDINKCLMNRSLADAKRLMDFSYSTRRGGQSKKAIIFYEQEAKDVLYKLKYVLEILTRNNINPHERYNVALATINSIKHVGQKIATMFLKFLIYYSEDFQGRGDLLREILIPLDSHVSRLVFTAFNGTQTNRLNLYEESIIQEELKYEVISTKPLQFKENRLIKMQRNIRNDFDTLNIKEPPIILDNLWYVGSFYCSNRYGDIGCKLCFLKKECKEAQNNNIREANTG